MNLALAALGLFIATGPAGNAAQAKTERANSPARLATAQTTTVADETVPVQVTSGRRFRRRAARFQPLQGFRPFEVDKTRFETRLGDVRNLPRSTTLPGADSGIPETLPVLPHYRDNMFQIPIR